MTNNNHEVRANDEVQDGTADGGAVPEARLVAWVHGRVQGVGFRWSTRAQALELGLTGYAKNYPDGRVLVKAEGTKLACTELYRWLKSDHTPGNVENVVADLVDAQGSYTNFICK